MDQSIFSKKYSILNNTLRATTLVAASYLAFSPAAHATIPPPCEFASSDHDDDGWGWENDASCVVEGSQIVPSAAAAVTYCQYLASDDDSDGWGWENNASCKIGTDSSDDTPAPTVYVPVASDNGKLICQTAEADPDGDGYGWENHASCVVPGSTAAAPAQNLKVICESASADPDNDGWGWENGTSCVVDQDTSDAADPDEVVTPTDDTDDDVTPTDDTDDDVTPTDDTDDDATPTDDTDDDATPTDDTDDDVTPTDDTDDDATPSDDDITPTDDTDAFSPSDITDLILITGQSNTLGANTDFSDTLDGPSPRVFAYTSNGWEVAELYQSWDNGAHPGTGNRSDVSKIHNNFALHFGKQLAELDENSVIGFVVVSEPGEGIEHWNPGNTGMTRAQQKTLAAINELPHKSAIDGILWHQGETDWILEGTSDPDVAQPAAIDYYPVALNELINNFRLENWFDANTPFICGETINAEGVNTHLNTLNTDGDSNTACVAGAGLDAISEGGSHFNAASLRTIGGRYAEAYYLLR